MPTAIARNAFCVLLLTGAGCVDARDAFDNFGDRVVDARTQEIDAGIVSDLPDITGDFFGVARPDLPKDRFLSFKMTFVFRSTSANTGELDWTAIALDVDTQEEVGQTFTADEVPVGSDGIAHIPMVGTLDGRANSVSGSTIQVDATVDAQLINPDFVCGGLVGTAGPLPLDGTTFGAQRYEGAFPALIANCADGPQPE